MTDTSCNNGERRSGTGLYDASSTGPTIVHLLKVWVEVEALSTMKHSLFVRAKLFHSSPIIPPCPFAELYSVSGGNTGEVVLEMTLSKRPECGAFVDVRPALHGFSHKRLEEDLC